MSVRVEWVGSQDVGISVLEKGDRAADGQKLEQPLGLVIGPLVIEGTRSELLRVAEVARELLRFGPISASE